jgi:hypothetical protein
MIINSNIKNFLTLTPQEYCFLKSMSIDRKISDEVYHKYDIELVLSKRPSSGSGDLRIKCTNAFDIKINNIEGLPGLLVEIKDVSANQIEGARFRVIEQEENAFSFYCSEFSAAISRCGRAVD